MNSSPVSHQPKAPPSATVVSLVSTVFFAGGMAVLVGMTWVSFRGVTVAEDQTEWVRHIQALILGGAATSAFLLVTGFVVLWRRVARAQVSEPVTTSPRLAIEALPSTP